MLALVLHFLLKTCSVHLHLPMLLLANLVSVPIEVSATASCMTHRPVLLPECACRSHDDYTTRKATCQTQSSAWQVACILPFMRLGEFIIRAPKLDAAPVAIKDMIFSNPGAALTGIGHALIGWLLAAPIIIVVLAQLLKPILAWAAQRYTAVVTVACFLYQGNMLLGHCQSIMHHVQSVILSDLAEMFAGTPSIANPLMTCMS